MEYNKEKLRKRVRLARKNKKLSVGKLAQLAGISPTTVWHYESGRFGPRIKNVVKISIALGVTVNWLLGLSDDEPKAASPSPKSARHTRCQDRECPGYPAIASDGIVLCQGRQCPGYHAYEHALRGEGEECSECGIAYTGRLVSSGKDSLCIDCAGILLTRQKVKVLELSTKKNKR